MACDHLDGHQKGGIKDRAIFGFFDESGVSDKPVVVSTWGRKGITPVILSSGGWKNLALLGLITYQPHTGRTTNLAWIRKGSVNKQTILRVLLDMKRKYEPLRKRFILLWDGLPVHRSKVVKTFIETNKSWLSLHRFPAYAPELNPQEYQWSALKRKDLGNYCPPTTAALAAKVRRGIGRMKNKSRMLKGFLLKSGLWNVKELSEHQ